MAADKTTAVSWDAVTAASAGGSPPQNPAEHDQRLRERLQSAVGDSFRLVELLGRGGMGIVFRAHETALDREVALKVLTLDPLLNPEAFTRFEREARLAARLDHPNIVPIFAVGSREGIAYYTMRLVRGGSVENLLEGRTPIALDQAVRILRDVAAALDYAHRNGVVHRDIKPANLLLGEGGHAMVADFGIAKGLGADGAGTTSVTGAAVIGSPGYMSPEQWRGEDLDGRADQYALGVVAFEMLTGRRPFETPRMQDLLKLHLTAPIPDASTIRPGLDPAVGEAIRRAMSKYANERFGSATAFVDALSGARAASGRAPRPASAAPRPRPAETRGSVVLPLLALTAVGVAVAFAVPRTRPLVLDAFETASARVEQYVGGGRAGARAVPAPVAPDSLASTARIGDSAMLALADSAEDSARAPTEAAPVRSPLPLSLTPDSTPIAGFRTREEPVVGFVRVTTRGGSARVRLDGTTLGFTPQVLRVDPGRHYVTVEGAGDTFMPTQIVVNVTVGDTASAEFATASAAPSNASAAPATPASAPAAPPATPQSPPPDSGHHS